MPTIENPIRKAGALADTLVDILNIAKVGLVASLEKAYPKTTFVPDKALSWVQLHDAKNLDKINKRVGDGVQALKKSAEQIQSGFSGFYDLLDNFRQDDDAPQEITYEYVAEQMATQGIDVDCWNINVHRRLIERGLQEAFSQAAAIRCAVEEAFAEYAILRVCPPDICDDPRGPTGEIYHVQKQPNGEPATPGPKSSDVQARVADIEKQLAEARHERDLAQSTANAERARADTAEAARKAAEARESDVIAAMAAAATPAPQRSGRSRRQRAAAGRTGGGTAVRSTGAAAKPQTARARPRRASGRTARPPAGGTTTNVP